MSQDHTPSPDPQPSEPSPPIAPTATPAFGKATSPASTNPSTLQKVKRFWQTVRSLAITIGSTAVQWGKQVRVMWNVIQPKVQRWWGATLPKIRGILPQAWNDRLTDRVMTGGAIALSVFFFWLTTSLLFPNRPTVAKTPPAGVIAPAAKVSPLAPAKLTEIQNQMAEVAKPYAPSGAGSGLDAPDLEAPKLIDWVRVNSSKERLTVQMGDGWYGLDAAQQDQLASDLWKRSLKLKFGQLEVADAAGKQLARSPVVGSKMVVLRRELQL